MKSLFLIGKLLFRLVVTSLVLANANAAALDKKLIEKIETYLTKSEANGFSGSFLISRNAKVLISKGYGFSNRKENSLNTTRTVFDMASNTKQFTATAILKLMEQQKLRLSDPLSNFFNDISEEKKSVTIHQLLTHTAGFEEYSGNDLDELNKSKFLKQVLHSRLNFTPGDKFEYSNVGYSVLAAIIEKVSNLDYEVYLSKYLFKPAALKNTGYTLPNWDLKNVAHGYRGSFEDIGSMIPEYMANGVSWNLLGNGGIHTTLDDLHLWYLALNNGKILTNQSVKLLFTPHVNEYEEDTNEHYAYGWKIRKTLRNTRFIKHTGSNSVFGTGIYILPDEDLAIFFWTNALYSAIYSMPYKIEKMFFDPTFQAKPVTPSPFLITYEFSLESKIEAINQLPQLLENRIGKKFNSSVFNRVGYWHLQNNNLKWAIALFKLNTQIFPEDGNLWDSLGEAYASNKQSDLAKKSFNKALALAPQKNCSWCDNTKKKIDLLQK